MTPAQKGMSTLLAEGIKQLVLYIQTLYVYLHLV